MVRTEKPQSRDPFTDGLLTFSPRKRQILEEAAKLIVKKGYAATSMNDIADQLGIRKASLYHHCKNKDDLHCLPRTKWKRHMDMVSMTAVATHC